MREGLVTDVRVKEGDHVAEGDPLLEVEAEKATDVILAPVAGRVISVRISPGDNVPVGTELISIVPRE